jgi:hypothetical protein
MCSLARLRFASFLNHCDEYVPRSALMQRTNRANQTAPRTKPVRGSDASLHDSE